MVTVLVTVVLLILLYVVCFGLYGNMIKRVHELMGIDPGAGVWVPVVQQFKINSIAYEHSIIPNIFMGLILLSFVVIFGLRFTTDETQLMSVVLDFAAIVTNFVWWILSAVTLYKSAKLCNVQENPIIACVFTPIGCISLLPAMHKGVASREQELVSSGQHI